MCVCVCVDFSFTAAQDTIESPDALDNPYDPRVTLGPQFLSLAPPYLIGVITGQLRCASSVSAPLFDLLCAVCVYLCVKQSCVYARFVFDCCPQTLTL